MFFWINGRNEKIPGYELGVVADLEKIWGRKEKEWRRQMEQ